MCLLASHRLHLKSNLANDDEPSTMANDNCRKTKWNETTKKNKIVKWNETVAPRIRAPEYTTGVVGMSVNIKCTVNAKPTPKVIFWRDHDGRIPVILGNNYRMQIDNDTEVRRWTRTRTHSTHTRAYTNTFARLLFTHHFYLVYVLCVFFSVGLFVRGYLVRACTISQNGSAHTP